jgi:hypothetical protein
MNKVQVISTYLINQVTTSHFLSYSMPDFEGCSEGSPCLTVLQAQDAVLLKKCKLVCCVLCSPLRKECFVLCLQLLICPDVAPCFCASVVCLEIPHLDGLMEWLCLHVLEVSSCSDLSFWISMEWL